MKKGENLLNRFSILIKDTNFSIVWLDIATQAVFILVKMILEKSFIVFQDKEIRIIRYEN